MTVAAQCRAANESRRRCPDTGVLRNPAIRMPRPPIPAWQPTGFSGACPISSHVPGPSHDSWTDPRRTTTRFSVGSATSGHISWLSRAFRSGEISPHSTPSRFSGGCPISRLFTHRRRIALLTCQDEGRAVRNRRRRHLGCRLLILVVWRSHGIVAVERSSGIVGSAACRTHAPRGCVRAQRLCAVGSLCNGKPPSPTLYRSSSLLC